MMNYWYCVSILPYRILILDNMHKAIILRNWTIDIMDLQSLSKEKQNDPHLYSGSLPWNNFKTAAYGAQETEPKVKTSSLS